MKKHWVQLTESRTEEAKSTRRMMMKKGIDWSPRRGKILVPRKDLIGNTVTAGQTKENLLVLVTPKSTSMQSKFIKSTSLTTKTMETSQKSIQRKFQTLNYLLADFHVRALALLENVKDLKTPEELCFLKSQGFLKIKNLVPSYLKTSKDCYLMTMETLSKPLSPRLMSWGMTSNGKCLTARISESPRIGKECSLSDILEEHPDQKYFLSQTIVDRLMSYRDTSLTPLPDATKGRKRQGRTLVRVNSMHKKTTQADRIYSKKGISPTIATAGGGRHIPQILED